MSIQIYAAASKLTKASGLNYTDKLILLRLADLANDMTASCTPAREKLASDCWCDERTVSRSISRMGRLGILTRQARKNDTNIYTINVAKLDSLQKGVA